MKNFNLIDETKFILSLLVVTIHCYIVQTIPNPLIKEVLKMVQHTSVPLFFCLTSFFVFSKLRKDYEAGNMVQGKTIIMKSCRRLMVMYLIWCGIYNIIVFPVDGIVPLLQNILFHGSAHLWYLWSCILCIPVIYWLLRFRGKPRMVMFAGLCAVLFFRVYSHYGSIENPSGISAVFAYVWKNNLFNVFGICNGFCYLAMGMLVALKNPMTNKKLLTLLFVIGVLISIPDHNRALGIGKIPIVYVLFCMLINNYNKYRGGGKFVRQMSTVIYLAHPIVINWVAKWLPSNNVYGWLLILTCCVIMSFAYVKLKEYHGFRWLSRLI